MIPISLSKEYIKTLLQSVNYMKPDLRIGLLMIVYNGDPHHMLTELDPGPLTGTISSYMKPS